MRIEQIHDRCTGCAACVTVCPKRCISLVADAEGFYYPRIDSAECVSCGRCERVCHCLEKKKTEGLVRVSHYGYSQKEEIRHNSSSGGVFAHLAQNVMDCGGNVYGAAFDYNALLLKHRSVEAVGLEALQKSKYVESYMGDIAMQIQRDLDAGQTVLFCGSPCQVSGIRRCIKDDEHRLLTCDFVCHGVPSAKLFKEHLLHIHKNRQVTYVDFRPKEYGWNSKYLVTRTSKTQRVMPFTLDSFYAGFMKYDAYLRESCYDCQFRKEHYSDITIGDFWGYRKLDADMRVEKGISLIVCNTEQGIQAVRGLRDFHLVEIDNQYSEYIYQEKTYPEGKKLRKVFFEYYKKAGFEKAASATYMKGVAAKRLRYYMKSFMKKLIGRK